MIFKKYLTVFHSFWMKLKGIQTHILKVGNFFKKLPGKGLENDLKISIGCELFNFQCKNFFKISGSVPKCTRLRIQNSRS